jgi:pyruvate-ferredoxin/flavodoxin oxidoreductase
MTAGTPRPGAVAGASGAARQLAESRTCISRAARRVNPFYADFPGVVQATMDRFAQLTGRAYRLFDYHGAADAERVIVIMGSGAEAVHETLDFLNAQGERVGLLRVRLYRPFQAEALIAALPETVRTIAVLDRTKEPGADGEPLYKDVVTALAQQQMRGDGRFGRLPRVIGGRYGLSSKEFTPGMIKAVFDELARATPKNGFTIGIHDDISHTSLAWDADFRTDAHAGCVQALFYGSVPTARSAPTRTPSRSSAKTPTCMRRGISSMTPRSPAR